MPVHNGNRHRGHVNFRDGYVSGIAVRRVTINKPTSMFSGPAIVANGTNDTHGDNAEWQTYSGVRVIVVYFQRVRVAGNVVEIYGPPNGVIEPKRGRTVIKTGRICGGYTGEMVANGVSMLSNDTMPVPDVFKNWLRVPSAMDPSTPDALKVATSTPVCPVRLPAPFRPGPPLWTTPPRRPQGRPNRFPYCRGPRPVKP